MTLRLWELLETAEEYRAEQRVFLKAKRARAEQLINLDDRIDGLVAVYSAAINAGHKSIERLKEFCLSLFSDKDETITLSSIHKAKGLEAEKVGILRPDLLPHPKADTLSQAEQERNLAYVAITRAKEELYIAGWFGFETEGAKEEEIENREAVAA